MAERKTATSRTATSSGCSSRHAGERFGFVSASVGIAGLNLGEGLGILGRKHGLTSDNLALRPRKCC